MEIHKIWAMPNSKTFTIKPIKEFVEKHISGCDCVIDPFANSCLYGTIRNDLNPEFDTQYHLDALEFLRQMESEVEFLTPKSASGNGEQVVTAKRERPQLEEIDDSSLPF